MIPIRAIIRRETRVFRLLRPIWPVVLVWLVAWGVPTIQQHDTNPCGALFSILYEIHMGTPNTDTSELTRLMGTQIVSHRMTEYYKSWPPTLACTATYWQMLLDRASS